MSEKATTAKMKRHRFTTSTTTPQQTLDPSSKHLPHIPFDLISKVLARLPVKSLLSFKRVCKSWNALISDHRFAKDQFQCRASPTDHLLLSFNNESAELLLRDFSLPSVFDCSVAVSSQRKFPLSGEEKRFRFFAGSCHGMLLLCVGRSCPVLWNPATGKFKDLPPLKNNLAYGFGYDHTSDSYKVVAVVSNTLCAGDNPEWDPRVKVHSLGSDSWREIQGFPASVTLMCHTGKFVSGALSWLAADVDNSTSNPWRVIASLDLVAETYHQHRLPPGCQGNFKALTLAVLKGCLCILSHCPLNSDVWLMKEYGNYESWTKVLGYPHDTEFPIHRPYTTRALCMSDDDEILLELNKEVVVYNSKSGTFRTTTGIQSFDGCIVAEVYAESLISP